MLFKRLVALLSVGILATFLGLGDVQDTSAQAKKDDKKEDPKKVDPKAKVDPKKEDPKKVDPKAKVDPKKVDPKKEDPKKVDPKKVDPKAKVDPKDEDTWPDVKGTIYVLKTVDSEKKSIIGTANGKDKTMTIGDDVKFLGPRGGEGDGFKDDRFVVGRKVKIVEVGGKVTEVHLDYRPKADKK